MILDQEFPPDVVERLEKISGALLPFVNAVHDWHCYDMKGGAIDLDVLERFERDTETFHLEMSAAGFAFATMPECPKSIFAAAYDGLTLAKIARRLEGTFNGFQESIREGNQSAHQNQLDLIRDIEGEIVKFYLSLRFSGVRMELPSMQVDTASERFKNLK